MWNLLIKWQNENIIVETWAEMGSQRSFRNILIYQIREISRRLGRGFIAHIAALTIALGPPITNKAITFPIS